VAPANETILVYPRHRECNVPLIFLKGAFWATRYCPALKTNETGYYATHTDHTEHAVEFDFTALQWGLCDFSTKSRKVWVTFPAPIKYQLQIFDEEHQIACSDWGPLDGEPTNDHTPQDDSESDHEDVEQINIPLTDTADTEEDKLAALANSIPTPKSSQAFAWFSTLASSMSQTQTTTKMASGSTLGQTLGSGVPPDNGPPGGGGNGGGGGNPGPCPLGHPGGGGNPLGGGGNPGDHPGEGTDKLIITQP
jgi:hypothetical protein